MKNLLVKIVLFALIVFIAQQFIYRILFSDMHDPIPTAKMYKDFPAIPKSVSGKLTSAIKGLNSTRLNDRLMSIESISKIGDKAKDAVPHLLVMLKKDNDPRVRAAVLITLGEIDDPRRVAGFIHGLSDERMENRIMAAEAALGRVADDEAIVPLIKALDDIHFDVKFAAMTSLVALTGKDFGTDSEKWQSWYDED